MEGVPEALQADLRQLQREEAEPGSLFEARRQAERAADLVTTFLESEGYYRARVEPHAEGADAFRRGVSVVHGPLFIYASARIDYLDTAPDQETRASIDTLIGGLTPGVPARAQQVITLGDAILRRLRESGYPDARQEPVDALADGAADTVDLTFRVRAGLRASFGDLTVSGLEATRPQFIEQLRPWKKGELITPAKLDAFRSRLAQTGLFSAASAVLSEGAPSGDGGEQRDILVQVTESERRTLAIGASVSTSEGAGLEGEWELRNYSGQGDALTLSGQVATLERRLGLAYRLPHFGHYGRILKAGAVLENMETDAYDQSGVTVSAAIEDELTPRTRASLGLAAGYASIVERAARLRGYARRNLVILSASASAEYVGVRDILDPLNGVRARIAIEPGLTSGDSRILYARLVGEASVYDDFGTDGVFVGALRGRLGSLVGPEGAPPDKKFFAGGGGSVRGYEFQSLSPRNAFNTLKGGRSLAEMSLEVRYRASSTLGYAAFIDAGAAGEASDPPLDSMRFGAGIGLRYYTSFGPLRADIAAPLSKRPGEADFQIYVSIGQAF